MLNMDILPLLVLCFSWHTEAVRSQMRLIPASLTIVRGDEARFMCSTSNTPWTVMTWLLGDRAVLSISKQDGVLPSVNPNVTAVKCSSSKTDCWEFVLRNTERSSQGQVVCDLQLIDKRTAELFVQEKGKVRVFGENRLAFKGSRSCLSVKQQDGTLNPPCSGRCMTKRDEVSPEDYNISTEEKENLFIVSSNLSVPAERSSVVGCLVSVSALKAPLQSSVRLTVVAEVLEEEDDCTVLVAVSASLGALLLLVLLSITTVLCYRQKRKARKTQEVIRSGQSVFGESSVAEVTGGNVNRGFSSEDATDHSSEVITRTRNQMSFDNFYKVPDVVHSSSLSLQTDDQTSEFQEDDTYSTTRRITTV